MTDTLLPTGSLTLSPRAVFRALLSLVLGISLAWPLSPAHARPQKAVTEEASKKGSDKKDSAKSKKDHDKKPSGKSSKKTADDEEDAPSKSKKRAHGAKDTQAKEGKPKSAKGKKGKTPPSDDEEEDTPKKSKARLKPDAKTSAKAKVEDLKSEVKDLKTQQTKAEKAVDKACPKPSKGKKAKAAKETKACKAAKAKLETIEDDLDDAEKATKKAKAHLEKTADLGHDGPREPLKLSGPLARANEDSAKAQAPAAIATYQAPSVRPFEMPRGVAAALASIPTVTGPAPVPDHSVTVEAYKGSYEKPKDAREQYYEQGVKGAFRAAQNRLGALDGQWIVKGASGNDLFSLVITDKGQPSVPIEGAFRDLRGLFSGFVSDLLISVTREGDRVQIRFQERGEKTPSSLTLSPGETGYVGEYQDPAGKTQPIVVNRKDL